MEGHPRHYSQHAAGIVIAAEPITNYVAIDHRSGATMCDKKDAEDYSLLKIDALGLTQLSVFEDCLAMAGLHRDILDQLPMDDQAAFDVLNAGKFSGIFQFNGPALKALTRQFKIDKFDDLVSITALARPGPLASVSGRKAPSPRALTRCKPPRCGMSCAPTALGHSTNRTRWPTASSAINAAG
jgi:DNA polymerase-3 subunit alpha